MCCSWAMPSSSLAERWGLAIEEPDWLDAAADGRAVGAVARDLDGHLAAATSTGGRVGQLPGRVGDSPVVGAGVWADDSTGAVSATGHGESFLLTAFAHEIDALMRLSGLSIGAACHGALERVSISGGLVTGSREPVTRPGNLDQARSKRSRFMTLSHAATKSRANFSFESSHA
jgi:hypothetical protein